MATYDVFIDWTDNIAEFETLVNDVGHDIDTPYSTGALTVPNDNPPVELIEISISNWGATITRDLTITLPATLIGVTPTFNTTPDTIVGSVYTFLASSLNTNLINYISIQFTGSAAGGETIGLGVTAAVPVPTFDVEFSRKDANSGGTFDTFFLASAVTSYNSSEVVPSDNPPVTDVKIAVYMTDEGAGMFATPMYVTIPASIIGVSSPTFDPAPTSSSGNTHRFDSLPADSLEITYTNVLGAAGGDTLAAVVSFTAPVATDSFTLKIGATTWITMVPTGAIEGPWTLTVNGGVTESDVTTATEATITADFDTQSVRYFNFFKADDQPITSIEVDYQLTEDVVTGAAKVAANKWVQCFLQNIFRATQPDHVTLTSITVAAVRSCGIMSGDY